MVFSSTTFLFLFLPAVIFFCWFPDVCSKITQLFCKKSLDNQDQNLALYSQTTTATSASDSVLTNESNLKEDAAPHNGEAVTEVTEGAHAEEIRGHIHFQQPKTIRIIINLFISSFLTNIILSIFLLFYCYVGVQIKDEDKCTDFHWIPNGIRTTMNEGFSWSRVDSNGYNNQKAFKRNDIDILLMGSSHSEAFQVNQNEMTISLLNKYLRSFNSYSIAVSGHDLYHCVNNINNAYNFYIPKKYIILETWRIVFDPLTLTNVINNKLTIKFLNEKIYKYFYYLQKFLPSTRSIIKQIRLWRAQSKKLFFTEKTINIDKDKSFYYKTLNKFLAFTRKSVPDNIPLIIFYHPSYTLQNDGSIKNNTDNWYLKTFSDACKYNNIIFIDTDSDLQELYKTRHILPYGFINTAVGVGHLNKYGHEVIAKRLAKEIIKLEGDKNGSK